MKIVLACDAFKGSLGATEVHRALAAGLPGHTVVSRPMADGGEGTVEALIEAGWQERSVTCSGPTGEPGTARWAYADGTAVVELADCCGLLRLPDGLAGLTASSRGLGEAMAAALTGSDPVERLVVGIGGSASTDAGLGMLAGLGAGLSDATGAPIQPGLAGAADLIEVDLSALPTALAEVELVVAADVTNPLLGPNGAAAIYGPQKGLTAEQISRADPVLARAADLVEAATDSCGLPRGTSAVRERPGAGAAGGVGFALLALGARFQPGVELVADLVGLAETISGADLVVTGEGRLDRQTLSGKAPMGVAQLARAAGVPVVAVCGRLDATPAEVTGAGFAAAYALAELEPDPRVSMAQAARLLTELAPRLLG